MFNSLMSVMRIVSGVPEPQPVGLGNLAVEHLRAFPLYRGPGHGGMMYNQVFSHQGAEA